TLCRSTGTVGINAQVGRIDLDFDRIVDFRVDKHAGKRRVAAVRRIKGALAHESVDTRFGTQESKGVITFDLDRCGLNAGDIAGRLFQDLDLEVFVLAATQEIGRAHVCTPVT